MSQKQRNGWTQGNDIEHGSACRQDDRLNKAKQRIYAIINLSVFALISTLTNTICFF
jgi:hypothetical protein